MDTDFSVISSTEESFLSFALFFLNPIGLFIGCLLLVILIRNFRANDTVIPYAVYSAIGSIAFHILLYFNDIFLANNLFIRWKFTDSNMHWATITDIISTVSYSVAKLLFYFAFTFHVLSVFTNYEDRKMELFLKIWMGFIGFICIIIMIVVCIDDATTNSSKEIGITSPHNIYVTVLASHKGAKVAKVAITSIILFDVVFFFVLIFVYIKKLKYLQNKAGAKDRKHLEMMTKGITLVIYSCITFWIFIIFVVTDIPLKWWGSFDITSDTLCLFLMFEFNNNLYNILCGICHKFWGKRLRFSVDQLSESINELPAVDNKETQI
eukprot:479359_1